jgi:hypothetical protein
MITPPRVLSATPTPAGRRGQQPLRLRPARGGPVPPSLLTSDSVGRTTLAIAEREADPVLIALGLDVSGETLPALKCARHIVALLPLGHWWKPDSIGKPPTNHEPQVQGTHHRCNSRNHHLSASLPGSAACSSLCCRSQGAPPGHMSAVLTARFSEIQRRRASTKPALTASHMSNAVSACMADCPS